MKTVVEVKDLVKRYKELVALDHFPIVDQRRGDFRSSWSKRFRKNDNNSLHFGFAFL